MGHDEDLYAILGVEPDAEPETIDHAFRDQMKKLHPDYARDAADVARRTTAASRLNHAADILRDPTARAGYDLDRSAARAAAYVAAHPKPTPGPMPRPASAYRSPSAPTPSAANPGVARFDLFHRRSPKSHADWFRYTRLGQWLTLFVVVVLASVLADLISPADIGLFTMRAALIWLVVGNIATRNLANPLGDLLRVGFRALDWLMDRYREQFVAKASH